MGIIEINLDFNQEWTLWILQIIKIQDIYLEPQGQKDEDIW
jgi:hypothetical protein